jgi:hypothetical protein
MKDAIRKLEVKLADLFKDTPKLSEGSRESVAQLLPWLAVLAAVLQTVAAYRLWKLLETVGTLSYYRSNVARYYSDTLLVMTDAERLMAYLALALLVAQVVMLAMAVTQLKDRLKSGWNLAFQAALLNIASTVLLLFVYDRGVDSVIVRLLIALFALYLLFQAREIFSKKLKAATVTHSITESKADSKPKE